jgi:hypothetical protein
MSARRVTRLQRLAEMVATAPLNTCVLEAAFTSFRATGRLPEDHRLSTAVIERAEATASSAPDEPIDLATGLQRLAELLRQIEADELPSVRTDELRTRLYREALDRDELVRETARLALVCIAATGVDVTQPLYLDEVLGKPGRGTAGMLVIGAGRYVTPPHSAHARRLLERAAAVGDVRPTTGTARQPGAGRLDAGLGPPMPDTKTLLDSLKRMVGLATELGLVGAGAVS